MRATPQILTSGNPLLLKVAEEVQFPDSSLNQEIADLALALDDFRERFGFGRAISAPQIGVSKRFIFLVLDDVGSVIVNPVITWKSEDTFFVWDDCLSVPNSVVRVERHCSISLRYQNEKGEHKAWGKVDASSSELLQHEIDHLDGILMTERATGEDPVRPISERDRLIVRS